MKRPEIEKERKMILKMRDMHEKDVVKKILHYAIRYAGSKILVVGRSYEKLRIQIMLPLMRVMPNRIYREDYKHGEICICNGSRILFRSVHSDEEAGRKCGGWNIDSVFCDEDILTGYESDEILFRLKTRLRGTRFPLRFYIGAEEVKLSADGGDTDPETESEAAAVPEKQA